MQRHRRCALLLGDPAGIEVGVVRLIYADTELDRHRDRGSRGCSYGGGDDLGEQSAFVGQGGSAAAAGHLRHRAAEVHVDVVGEAVLGDHPDRLVGVRRIDGVQL